MSLATKFQRNNKPQKGSFLVLVYFNFQSSIAFQATLLPLHTVNEVKITPIKVKKRYPPPWKLKVVKVFLEFYVYLCTHKSEYNLFKGL